MSMHNQWQTAPSLSSILLPDPLIIHSPADHNIISKREFVIPGNVKNIRVYAEFWQREANGNEKCVVDFGKPSPSDGIPFLKTVGTFGNDTGGKCIYARTRETYPVIYTP